MTPAISLSLAPPAVRASRPGLCMLNILAADVLAVSLSLVIAVLLRSALGGTIDFLAYARISAGLLLFPMAYGVFGQYSPVAHNPVREIRRLTTATTLVFVLFSALLFLFKVGPEYSRIAFLGAWVLTLISVPCARAAVRALYADAPWWGYPVAIFGSRESAIELIEGLRKQPETGLRPAAVFLADGSRGESIQDVPVLGDFTSAPLYARRFKISRALVMLSDVQGTNLPDMLESHANVFSHVYLMPGLDGFSSFGIETQDVCNGVALELRRSLLLPSRQLLKRVTDAIVSGILLALIFPLLLLIALLVRLESPGGVLFGHKRIGHGGRKFKMWKFRTMYANGAEILDAYLKQNPGEEQCWRENMKLRNDPRITPLGAILRKTSLDELPQLWNILRGEMSLVGPRPIVNDEVAKYGERFGLYCRVIPGLTGLWQVSGRSTTTYERRVELDTYYVRNWSPWLDIYLLARTVRTVLLREGAY